MRRFVGLALPDETSARHAERSLTEIERIWPLFDMQELGDFPSLSLRDASGMHGAEQRCGERHVGVQGPRRLWNLVAAETASASVRAKVEHPFLWVKRRLGALTAGVAAGAIW